MKNLIIILLILLEIGTIFWAKNAMYQDHKLVQMEVRELNGFYDGFCADVKDSGLGFGENYKRLCL